MLKNEKNYFIIKMILQIKYKRVKKMKKTLCIILIIILLPIFFVNMVILIDAWTHPDEVPSFFGWKPFIVLAESMEHTIYSGDVVIVKEIDSKELKKGDIIAYKQENIVFFFFLSQVINENESTKYITKGDNIADVDPGYVLESQFEGILKKKKKKIGNLIIFIQTPLGTFTLLSIPLILLILVDLRESVRNKHIINEEEDKQKKLEEEIEALKKENEELKNTK